MATRGGADLQIKKLVGRVSTTMRLLTSKDGVLSSCFDKTNENDNVNTSIKDILINNQGIDANKGKLKEHLPLENKFGFCRTFEKITNNLEFHITFKTADSQDIVCIILSGGININFNNFHLFVPIYIPSAETQAMFIEFIKNIYTILFASWYTDRKVVSVGLELQVEIGSARKTNYSKKKFQLIKL